MQPARSHVERLIVEAGGQFSRGLSANCTHLVVCEATGKKFKFAQASATIACVNFDWLQGCVAEGRVLEEEAFHPLGEAGDGGEEGAGGGGDGGVKVEAEARSTEKAAERREADVVLPGAGEGERDVVDGIAEGRSRAPFSHRAGVSRSGDATGRVSGRADSAKGAASASVAEPTATAETMSVVDELAHIPESFALESCCIYLVPSVVDREAAHKRQRAALMRLSALAGATVAPRWSPIITHALITAVPLAEYQVAELRDGVARGLVVVDADWLRQSAASASQLAPEDYEPPSWATSAVPNRVSDFASGSGMGFMRDNTVTLGGDLSAAAGVTSLAFQGMRLACGPLHLDYAPDICSALTTKVLAGRGKVLAHHPTGMVSGGVPTHVLCPPGLTPGLLRIVRKIRETNTHVELVTPDWINCCSEEQKFLPPAICALFTAREFVLPLKSFTAKRLVLTISGFYAKPPSRDWNRRREVLGQLASLLGAVYTEKMKRTSCTHLLVESDTEEVSEKVRCALQWDVVIISERWLLACAEAGRLVPTKPYIVSFPEELIDSQEREGDRGSRGRPSLSTKSAPLSGPLGSHSASLKRLSGEPSSAGLDDGESKRRKPNRSSSPNNTSAEALMKQLAASLVKATDVNTAAAGNENEIGLPVDTRLGLSGDGLGTGSNIEPSRPAVRGRRHSSFIEDEEKVAPRRSEWSLEASQSQVIVHRDLTPPPATFDEPKPVPRLRRMPSRAAKSKP